MKNRVKAKKNVFFKRLTDKKTKTLRKQILFLNKIIIILIFIFCLQFDFKSISTNIDNLNYIKHIFSLSNIFVFKKNIFQNNTIHGYKSQTKICLCIIAKKENRYIKDYINYYKKIGYNHIFLYDNNDINDERFEDVIQNEINENFVSVINCRGYKKFQISSYYDCYKNNNKNYSWLSFFDSDEYLEIKPNNISIQEFLDNERFKNCQNIKINWIIYTDNDLIYYENKSLIKRFTNKILIKANIHIKSTVRGNLSHNYWKLGVNPHTSNDKKFSACSSSGKRTNPINFFVYPPDYTNAILRHYNTKTIEEYTQKIKRGRPDITNHFNIKQIKQKFNYFFSINTKTKEKVDFFNKVFNVNFT